MMKRLLLSGAALSVMATFAIAQTADTAPANNAPPHATSPATAPATSNQAASDPAAANAQAQADDPNLYSNIQGADLVGTGDTSLGRVADILVDGSGQLRQIVFGHGGLLGIGETLRVQDATELPRVADGKVAMPNMTEEQLKALPEYTYPEATSSAANGTNTTSATSDAANSGSAMSNSTTGANQTATSGATAPAGTVAPGGNLSSGTDTGTMADNAAPAPAPGQTMAETGTTGSAPAANGGTAMSSTTGTNATTAPMSSDNNTAPISGSALWPASYLVGANITNAQDSAAINDLRFEGNRVAAVLVDKGSLGLGNDVTEVQFEQLNIAGTPKSPEISLKSGTPGVGVEGATPAR